MVSVLFVDDNASGLRNMRETFDRPTLQWDAAFLPGPGAALEIMEERPVDAVVASSRLVGMTTAEFFRLTKSIYPQTARIALSDPADRGAMLSTLPVANQSLTRACGPEVMARVVDKTSRLQADLFSPAVRRLVAAMGPVPSLPDNLLALDMALADEDCSLGDVADIIARDVALVGKVLTLVNSSFFGLRTRVYDVRQAVAYLGIETLRDFAMASEAFGALAKNPRLSDRWLAAVNNHSMAVADVAGRLVRTSAAQCGANVAGMLHDIGELVVAQYDPGLLEAVAWDLRDGCPVETAEMEHIGMTVPVIGGHLLSVWGIGNHVVEAVTYQREERPGPQREADLADVVHVADYAAVRMVAPIDLTDEGGPTPGTRGLPWVCPSGQTEVGMGYLERVGLLGAINSLRRGTVGAH